MPSVAGGASAHGSVDGGRVFRNRELEVGRLTSSVAVLDVGIVVVGLDDVVVTLAAVRKDVDTDVPRGGRRGRGGGSGGELMELFCWRA